MNRFAAYFFYFRFPTPQAVGRKYRERFGQREIPVKTASPKLAVFCCARFP